MDGGETLEISMLDSVAQISAAEWDACADQPGDRPENPFITHRFLDALERSGSVGPGTGWQPRHLVARMAGEVIAVMPMYAKGHSQGEYIFDFDWAHAYEQAGGRYYPKLQSAAPFTPVTGRRFLTRAGHETIGRGALLQGVIQVATNSEVSSFHATFCTAEEREWGESVGLLGRVTRQFHWENRDYADFDAFLADLSSRKRKAIRKERKKAREFGGRIVALTGDGIEPEHWDAFWAFYQDTGARKWGTPYLTRQFFDIAHETMRDDMLLVLAERDGRWVAGALNFIGAETLYGRYWGCVEDHPCLHFELCYYQAIDFAIGNGIDRVEAGAQGEHKLARGYLPTVTHSLHWFRDEGFSRAVENYLKQEAEHIGEEIQIMMDYAPFRKGESENG